MNNAANTVKQGGNGGLVAVVVGHRATVAVLEAWSGYRLCQQGTEQCRAVPGSRRVARAYFELRS